jgi:hypothetical protein
MLSRCLKLRLPVEIIVSMEAVYLECLSGVRAMVNERVLTIHPRIFLISSILPSALNFFSKIISFLGTGLFLFIQSNR